MHLARAGDLCWALRLQLRQDISERSPDLLAHGDTRAGVQELCQRADYRAGDATGPNAGQGLCRQLLLQQLASVRAALGQAPQQCLPERVSGAGHLEQQHRHLAPVLMPQTVMRPPIDWQSQACYIRSRRSPSRP